MNIGAHVKGGGTLIPSLAAGNAIGATSIQIFTQSPRMWKPSLYSDEVLEKFREAHAAHPTIGEVFCHATYLINVATPDPELLAKSQAALTHNMSVGRRMGSAGVVVHTGSHMGQGFDAQLPQIASTFLRALDESDPSPAGVADCPLLIENTAGAGGTVGRSLDEIEAMFGACGFDERLGLCIDTQHLWASGGDFSTMEGAQRLVDEIDQRIGLHRLKCFHLNDSKIVLGGNKDRHANIGEGEIGVEGLATLMGHPAMRNVPMQLEVPGDGDGPRAQDVTAAQRAWELGVALYSDTAAARSAQKSKKKTAKK